MSVGGVRRRKPLSHVGVPLLCHANSPRSSATSLTHTDSLGGLQPAEGGGGDSNIKETRAWAGCRGKKGWDSGVKGRQTGWGKVVGGRAGQEQSVLYSHSLNPLWNRSMKWHSPVQKRKVKRQVMREDIAASISAPDSLRW